MMDFVAEKPLNLLFATAAYEFAELGKPPSNRREFVRWLATGGVPPPNVGFLSWNRVVPRAPKPYATRLVGSGDTPEQQSQIADALYARLVWAQYGFNVVDITDSLASALLLTRTGLFDGLAWPYPAFALRTPPGLLTVKDASGVARNIPFLVAHRYDEGLRISAFCEDKREIWADQLNDWYVRFSEADDIEMLYAAKVTQVYTHADSDKEMESELRYKAIRLVVNFVSWLATRPFKEAGSPSNKAAKQAACKRRTYPVWTFGKDVKLPAELRAIARKSVADTLWEQQVRYVVRGHFRRKPGAKNSTESVEKAAPHQKVWISPFWKGPEGGPTWTHTYKTEP